MRNALIFALLLLALSGCSPGGGDEAPLPTSAPTVAVEPDAADEAATAGESSPRVTPRAGSGVPPTWTPLPPPPTPAPLGTAAPAFRPAPGEGASEGQVYEVEAGDTLAEIAARFGVDLERLAAANGIDDVDHVEAGQLLVIPQ
jgi:LysM repeat protein